MFSGRRTTRLLAVSFLSAASIFSGCSRTEQPISPFADQEILVWGLWQESTHMAQAIKAFEDQFGAKVKYKKIASVASYEKELLSALAEGRGPDAFVIHHTWVDGKRGLLSPAPPHIVDAKAIAD